MNEPSSTPLLRSPLPSEPREIGDIYTQGQTASQRVIHTSDAFFRRFVPIWIIFSGVLSLYTYVWEPDSFYAGLVSLMGGLLVLIALQSQRAIWVRWLFITPIYLTLMIAPWWVNGVRTPLLMHMMLLLIFTGWLLGTRAMWFIALSLSTMVMAVWYSESRGLWQPPQDLRGIDMWVLSLQFSLLLTPVVLSRFIHNYRVDLQREVTLQHRLQTAMQFNALIIESSPVPIRVFGPQGQCVAVNGAYTRLMGQSADTLLGQSLYDNTLQGAVLTAECQQVLESGQSAEHEVQITTVGGHELWLHAQLIAFEREGQRHLLAHFVDVSERHRTTQDLKKMAFYDSLTGLPNRRLLWDHFQQRQSAWASNNEWSAVVLLDLNQFKQLNDLHGHAAGDQMLQEVARRLQQTVRTSDVIARLGGDEFTLLLSNLGDHQAQAQHNMQLLCDQLHTVLSQPYCLRNTTHEASASIGFALIDPHQSITFDELLRQADAQMYAQKKATRREFAGQSSAAGHFN